MDCRHHLMACSALVGVWLLLPSAAAAQPMSDAAKIERLERQTELLQKQSELLQRQLQEVKEELARTRKQTDKMEAKVEAAPRAAPAHAPAGHVGAPITKAPAPAEKVKVTLGGFVAAETVWRQRNEVSDVGSPFGAIPYPFSPLYNENEFHGTARQSRISLLVEGNIDPLQKLVGYYETDFLGVGTASNYTQSNSWVLRLRHAYLTYDNSGWGFHLLAGQAWSLLTQNQVGITPRKESIPLTIDANYVVGFNFTRNWQIRAVQDLGPGISLGVSVEAPAAIVAASTATAPAGLGGTFSSGGIVNGIEVNFANPGGTFLTGATITTDQAPDIIEKLALDPGWGHYEIFGLQRFFTDNTLACFQGPCVAGSTVMSGNTATKIASDEIIEKGRRIAGRLLEAEPADIEFSDGQFRVRGSNRSIGLFDVATAAVERNDTPDDLRGPLAATCDKTVNEAAFAYGAHVCEVEVDPKLGNVAIVRYTTVDDVGRAVNPLIVHGQSQGGIAQGVGEALLEHCVYDAGSGQLLSGSFMDYAMPRADDFPFFNTQISEVPTPQHPLGIRPAGEGGTTPALAVVINALADALADLGVRHVEMPATPERVWRAIHGMAEPSPAHAANV